jgi:hypothetical protein
MQNLFDQQPAAGIEPRAREARPIVHRRPTSTERAAAVAIEPRRETLRVRVLAVIRAMGSHGATPREIIIGGSPEYSIRPRITELARAGFIEKAGGARDGCAVWLATDKPGDGSECDAPPLPNAKKIVRELLAAIEAAGESDLLLSGAVQRAREFVR